MAGFSIKHKKVATFPDDPEYEINSTEWNEEHEVVPPQELDPESTPTFEGLILSDPMGNKWKLTVTEEGNISAEPLLLP